MNSQFKLIKKCDFNTSKWSGGTTTELFIYPENSSYKDRDFMWRISSATVSIEESEFTNLPGVLRHIMPLYGELKLYHKNHHEAVLKPFQVDTFKGDWVTKSIGIVRDFNLMLCKGTDGFIEALSIENNDVLNIKESCIKQGYCSGVETFFSLGKDMVIAFNDYEIPLSMEDFFIVELGTKTLDITLKNNDTEKASLIRSKIYF